MRIILGLLVLKDKRVRKGNLQPKKGKNLPQVLFQSYIRKVKRNVERENPLQIAAIQENSPQKLHNTQPRKRNIVRGEDEIIPQLLGIHPHLMEMIQMTYNMRGLKQQLKMRNLNGSFPKGWQVMPTNISKNLSPRET